MSLSYLDDQNRFVIEDFDSFPPFASFLPGIAGPLGVPLWAFYVNRGQAIASFGVESKDSPILEFEPANKAYQTTPFTGFRTFVKIIDAGEGVLYEPFAPWSAGDRTGMVVGMNELQLAARSPRWGLQTDVVYFTLPGEPFAGLVRTVTITNVGHAACALEILDGLPRVIPYGVDNRGLKEISRTLEAWMEVLNVDERVPFYRLRASAADEAEVQAIVAGHFALACATGPGASGGLLPVFVDPEVIFGRNTAISTPDRFVGEGLAQLGAVRQFTGGKTPCSFFGVAATLEPAESITLCELFGHAGTADRLDTAKDLMLTPGYPARKRQEAALLVQDLTGPIATRTGDPIFDAYCRQTFLDNVLRGGWPLLLPPPGWAESEGDADRSHVFHIYARKHGDLERDYNAFFLAAEPYSQGNGNYRDVNQNRRSDVLFEPGVGDFNIRLFMSLIQADGYNPLVVQGTSFTLAETNRSQVLAQVAQPEKLAPLLSGPFTPGGLLRHIQDHNIALRVPPESFLALALQRARQHILADHGEGFWIDHWTYNLDLIDSFLALYPDRKQELLFGTVLPFFDSAATVLPRSEKHVLADGQPRQFHAVVADEAKGALIAARAADPNWARDRHGEGDVFQVTLFEKLVTLAVIKFATLDPAGLGVEMEAGKPGWYDALNGLPGLFGSSLAETFELQRLLQFLVAAGEERGGGSIDLPLEVSDLLHAVADRLDLFYVSSGNDGEFAYWNDVARARESYRDRVRLGFHGAKVAQPLVDLLQTLRVFLEKVQDGIRRANAVGGGLPPTYFVHQVEDYQLLTDGDGAAQMDSAGRPRICVTGFSTAALPPFLEGPVRAMRVTPNRSAAQALHRSVAASDLYDRALGLFKVNTSLAAQPHSIGRARAFTPGWLENESIWLHMAYKYLLALLRAGLTDEFWAEARRGLVPFMDPAVYGRSPLENSSFIVSSAHPDPGLHGRGFVARLSGATAEFLSMWQIMMAGSQPFLMADGELCLALRPALPGWLFDDQDRIGFRFLGRTTVTYHNPRRLDTWQAGASRITLVADGARPVTVASPILRQPYSGLVRAGRVTAIDLYFD